MLQLDVIQQSALYCYYDIINIPSPDAAVDAPAANDRSLHPSARSPTLMESILRAALSTS